MLDRLQYRMAEVIFRPLHVLRTCWTGGRQIRRHYTLAALAVFLPTLGFGLLLGKGLSGEAFRVDADPSLIGNVGIMFVTIWTAFSFYSCLIAVAISLISTVRR